MRTRSLAFRLVSFYAGVVAVAFVLLGGFTQMGTRHFLEAQLRQASERRAGLIARELLSQAGARGWGYVVEEIKARFSPEAVGRFIRVSTAGGLVLYRSDKPQDQSFDPEQIPLLPLLPVDKPATRRVVQADGRSVMVSAVPWRSPTGESYLVEVGASLLPISQTLRDFLPALLVGFGGVIAISIGGGYFLVRRALAPVEGIARSAEQITFQNPSQRLPVASTGDELEQLSLALNRMLARLEDSYQQAKRFSADASHELRTPLSIIRGELEGLVETRVTDRTSRDALGSVLEEVDRLSKIVENLLALTRLDGGEAKTESLPVDLCELACSTADQMGLLAEDKHVTIRCEAPEAVYVAGDRSRLKQVVVNLLDNAIKFTPEGGTVELRVRSTNGCALFEVADTGLGIPAEALQRVFDRFYRVDKARSREQGGAGIGLSIVKSIVLAHDGVVEARPNTPRGSCFVIQMPRLSPPPSRADDRFHQEPSTVKS